MSLRLVRIADALRSASQFSGRPVFFESEEHVSLDKLEALRKLAALV